MPGYTVRKLEDVNNIFEGSYPGEMRMVTYEIDAEQVALTYRRMPQHTGGKGSYGHRHRTQEELYHVISGRLQFKLDDDVLEVDGGTTVRVAPEVARSVWNDEPEDAELIIVSIRIENPQGDTEQVPDFWPED
jgi:mannose-6-phosphate isomerase-like protein (cupin superfamily)